MNSSSHLTWLQIAIAACVAMVLSLATAAGEGPRKVDFRHTPPEWQTAICLPDDPHKSLVDRSGELLYHFGQGGREFATRVRVEVVDDAVWENQELYSPRVPVVRTRRVAEGLEIVEEAFAVTDLRQPDLPVAPLQRVDAGGVNRDWAKPPAGVDTSLRHIAVHMGGSIQYELVVPAGAARRIALALCEGWWNEAGQRVQTLRVEGAEPKTIDLVADLGQNKAEAYWFEAQDANRDGRIDISIDAAPQAADKNTILNGLWVFPADTPPDTTALLAGKLNAVALARMSTTSPGGPAHNDVIIVRVTNTGTTARTVQPRLIVDTTHSCLFQSDNQRVVINEHETITTSLRLVGTPQEQQSRRTLQLEALTIPAGQTATFFVLYSGGGSIVSEPSNVEQALACRARAVAYWEKVTTALWPH